MRPLLLVGLIQEGFRFPVFSFEVGTSEIDSVYEFDFVVLNASRFSLQMVQRKRNTKTCYQN